MNRYLRLLPLHCLNMIFTFFTVETYCNTKWELIRGFLMIDNWFTSDKGAPDHCTTVGWTMCVDFQCYLIFIFLFVFLNNFTKNQEIMILYFIIVLGWIKRAFTFWFQSITVLYSVMFFVTFFVLFFFLSNF